MVSPTPYQGVQVDSRYNSLQSLLQYVDGSSWTVNYYSQILDESNQLSAQQTELSPIYQQYLLIHKLEMKVQSPLTMTATTPDKEAEIVGNALLYPGLIPNKGDMFIADIGDGRAAIFSVTLTEKKSLLKDSLYQIEYVLKGYSTPEALDDFRRKTIREAQWVKDYLKFGQNPQVMAPDFADLQKLNRLYQRLVNEFFSDYYSHDHQTLIVPDQANATYDPFLTTAVLNWVDTDEHPYLQRIRRLNVDSEAIMRTPTVWDAISHMSDSVLPRVATRVGVVSVRQFFADAQMGGIYYSGLARCVYPLEGRTDGDRGHGHEPLTEANALSAGRYRWSDISRRLLVTELPDLSYTPSPESELPLVSAITELPTYLFSMNFYMGEGPYSSVLEKTLADALSGELIDPTTLVTLAESSVRWDSVERFYYIPVLIALLKTRIRTNP